jgi:hypothetical protein
VNFNLDKRSSCCFSPIAYTIISNLSQPSHGNKVKVTLREKDQGTKTLCVNAFTTIRLLLEDKADSHIISKIDDKRMWILGSANIPLALLAGNSEAITLEILNESF